MPLSLLALWTSDKSCPFHLRFMYLISLFSYLRGACVDFPLGASTSTFRESTFDLDCEARCTGFTPNPYYSSLLFLIVVPWLNCLRQTSCLLISVLAPLARRLTRISPRALQVLSIAGLPLRILPSVLLHRFSPTQPYRCDIFLRYVMF
jgi:hypothetical protein